MLVAFGAPVLITALAIGIEVSSWTVTQQRLQRTADMAAIAAAQAYTNNPSAQVAANTGAYVAEINGAVGSASRPPAWNANTNTVSDNMITVAMTTGIKSSSDKAFVATVRKSIPLLFSSIVLGGANQTLTATATAEIAKSQNGKYCLLATDPNSSDIGINVNNGASIDTSQCGVQVNSAYVGSSSAALTVIGGAKLQATNVSIVGNYAVNNGGTLTVTGTTTTGAAAGSNPYANITPPTAATCPTAEPTSLTTSGPVTISPGTFCGGLTTGNNAQVTMNPGVYIMYNGSFTVGSGSVTANGVTIYLTGSTAGNIGTATIGNGNPFTIVAPTTGATAGIAILQDPRVAPTATNNFNGGTSMSITGALDFSSVVDFSNGSTNNSTCTQVIAYQILFVGGAKFGNNCSGTGTSGIGASSTVTLVQ